MQRHGEKWVFVYCSLHTAVLGWAGWNLRMECTHLHTPGHKFVALTGCKVQGDALPYPTRAKFAERALFRPSGICAPPAAGGLAFDYVILFRIPVFPSLTAFEGWYGRRGVRVVYWNFHFKRRLFTRKEFPMQVVCMARCVWKIGHC